MLPRMSPLRFGVFAATLAFCAAPAAVRPALAQVPPGSCCQTCRLPAGTCTCTTMHPVVQTRYRQEQVVSYHRVNRVALKQQPYCVTVPRQHVYNVTRDEGCYKMVWVPKPVTRQYCRTTYEKQMKCRTVPVQYTECVPKVCTQTVPEQCVSYVPVTTTQQLTMDVTTCVAPPVCPAPVCPPTCAPPPPACTAPAAIFSAPPDCSVPGAVPGAVPGPVPGAVPGVMPGAVPAPLTQPHPSAQPLPPGTEPLGSYNQGPNLVPNPQHLEPPAAGTYDQWSTVPGRQHVDAGAQATAAGRPIQIPTNTAPTAATVWQVRAH